MYSKTLTFHGQRRSFAVEPVAASGWELRVEHDSIIVRRAHYSDWHRVERAVDALEREMRDLEARGWRPTDEVGVSDTQSTNR
jgi:hypothetical protein